MTFRMTVNSAPPNSVFVLDKKQLRSVLRAAGGEVAAAARRLIRGAAGSGRVYYGSGSARYRPYRKGRYTASAPGQPPVNVTGTLLRSIRTTVAGQSAIVRAGVFYALFLEVGAKGGGRAKGSRGRKGVGRTRVLEPRDFLGEALASRQVSIGERVQEAIATGIAFRRMK